MYSSIVPGCKYLEPREAGVYYRAFVTSHGSTSNGGPILTPAWQFVADEALSLLYSRFDF